MSDKKTIGLARIREQHRFWTVQVATVAGLLHRALGSGTIIACAYFAYLSVQAAAGQTTDFRAVVDLLIKGDLNKHMGWVIAAIATGSAFHQKSLRKREVATLSRHNKELEAQIDPDRSSSGLGPAGTPKASGE